MHIYVYADAAAEMALSVINSTLQLHSAAAASCGAAKKLSETMGSDLC